ncbi:AAA family ATPase [[Clostridium] colinum]|uniref:AAA family ATPase n=1 Tax=[Clostridium] colinum TaxID=36835 RepID=UPI0020247235|nr:AAA family ATPase [[Clostridium] colinum]
MKPQMLKITGINSFDKTQEIDFSKILEKGIFGIFGDTGSGKSTIIDAITLALYGKIVRYDGKAGNGDFLNLNRNNAKVEFIFSIKEGKEEIFYEIIRQFKRDNKGKIKSEVIRLSIFKGEEKEIISDKKQDTENKIVDIIGLSYEDFTKAVVLPQGKFSDFLMLENTDKRKMLQRIFGLEKYGDRLKDKINEKKSIQENIVENLKKEIEIYGSVYIEDIEKEKEALKEKENILTDINKNIKKIEEEEKYFINVLNIKNEYLDYNNKLQELIPYKQTVLDFENKLNFILEAEKISPYILELDTMKNQNKFILENLNKLNNKFSNIKNDYDSIEKEYNYCKNKKDEEKPKLDKIKQDLELCISFINEKNVLEQELYHIEDLLKNSVKNKKDYKNKIVEIENKKDLLKKEIDDIILFNQKNKIDNNLKEAFKNAIDLKNEQNNINTKIEDIKININLNKKKIDENEVNIKKIKQNILYIENIIKKIVINNVHKLENDIIYNNNIVEQKINENSIIEQEIENLNIQIKIQENKEVLQNLAKNLLENKPCPLCGSINHPNPIKVILDNIIDTLINKKINKENQIKENTKYINNLNLENNIIHKIIEDLKVIGKKYFIKDYQDFNDEYVFNNNEILPNIYKYEEEFKENEKQLNMFIISNENILNFIDEKNEEVAKNNKLIEDIANKLEHYYNILKTDDFYKEYENMLIIEKQINENNDKYLSINKELEDIDSKNSNIIESLNKLEKEEVLLLTKKEQKQDNINNLMIKINQLSYDKNPQEYILIIEKDINKILEAEEKYKILFEKILNEKNELEKCINENLIKIKINEDNIQKKEMYIDEFIQKSIFKNKLEILENYKEIEKKDFYAQKVKSYQEKVDNYTFNIKRLEKDFKNLDIKLDIEVDFLNEKIDNITNKKEELYKQNNIFIESITTLKINISQKEEILKKTEKISKLIKEEEKKLDILKELSDLNKAGAFVEFVANRHLKHIVLDASKRLFNMSQSKYSLELLDNSFVIKDNYNGGIVRSPRSLSGGEVFMASLSLALALSSKIQLKNKSPLEIFFLDEGFGTLDNNTLDTVINTLEQLQNSNISVGIITHVEEIKNRVQNKINVLASEDGAKVTI